MDVNWGVWALGAVWLAAIVTATWIGANRGHSSRWWPVFFLVLPISSFIAIPLWLAFERPVKRSGFDRPEAVDRA
jgi:hypothetical protein